LLPPLRQPLIFSGGEPAALEALSSAHANFSARCTAFSDATLRFAFSRQPFSPRHRPPIHFRYPFDAFRLLILPRR